MEKFRQMIYFVTNRNPNRKHNPDDFGKGFNQVAADNLRFGRAVRTRQGDISIDVEPEILHRNEKNQIYGSKKVFAELKASMAAGSDTLLFIHGYNVSFRGALEAGFQLQEVYGTPRHLNVVVFSWPSDGSMMPLLAYRSDRTDARLSAPALARGFAKLHALMKEIDRSEVCGGKIHLMCHSMGNYVLRNGIYEVQKTLGGLPRLFDEIFLMAADEDHDAFEFDYKLLPLPELGRSVHVYFNRGDTALVISDKTKSNPTRLGSYGPRAPLTVPGNVDLVDCSEVVDGHLEHNYYLTDLNTIRDVRAVLAGQALDLIGQRRYLASQNKYMLQSG